MKFLVLSHKKDLHVRAVQKHFLNSSDFLFINPASKSDLRYTYTSDGMQVFCNNELIPLSDIQAVWTRKYSSAAFRDLYTEQDTDLEILQKKHKSMTQVAFLRELSAHIKFANPSCLFVNFFLDNLRNEYRLLQLTMAKDIGFTIPNTLVSENKKEILQFLNSHASVTKRLYQGGVSFGKIGHSFGTLAITASDIKNPDQKYYDSPVFLQENVSKEYELRVTVIGKKIFACKFDNQRDNLAEKSKLDWRFGIRSIPHTTYKLPEQIKEMCFTLLKKMGLQYGAIDMIKTKDGRYVFLEINANGQFLWIEEATGMEMSKAMAELLMNPKKNRL